jgi:hypothetical protein
LSNPELRRTSAREESVSQFRQKATALASTAFFHKRSSAKRAGV